MFCDVRDGLIRKFLHSFRQSFFDKRLSHELSRPFRTEFAERLQPSHFADAFKRSLRGCVKPCRLTCGKRVYAFLCKVVVRVPCGATRHKCDTQCRVCGTCCKLQHHQGRIFNNHATDFLWIRELTFIDVRFPVCSRKCVFSRLNAKACAFPDRGGSLTFYSAKRFLVGVAVHKSRSFKVVFQFLHDNGSCPRRHRRYTFYRAQKALWNISKPIVKFSCPVVVIFLTIKKPSCVNRLKFVWLIVVILQPIPCHKCLSPY